MKPRRHFDVIIIGGGLHGLSAALYAARAGLDVVVLEKDYPGRHASGVNAGGVRRLGRHLDEIPLSVAAMDIWHHIDELVADDCRFSVCSQIKVAETTDELSALEQRAATVRELGYSHEEIIDAKELREHVPAIAPHCVGAMICRDDGAADPFHTVTAFRRQAIADGATVLGGVRVNALDRNNAVWRVKTEDGLFEAPDVVNATGAWAGALAAQLGEVVPLMPQALMLMITERVQPFLTPVLGAQGRTLSFKQFANGTVMIGGGHLGQADLDSNRTNLHLAGLKISAQTVVALFPQLHNVHVNRAWAGIEAVMPDKIPVIGPSATEEGLYHSFGYCGHGFQLSPITGKIIAELIVSGESSLPIAPFRIDRFK